MREIKKISKIKREPFFNMKSAHMHNEHEIYYLSSGERYFIVNEKVVTIKKGDLVIIPAGNIHKTAYSDSNSHERISFLFDDSIMNEIYEDLGKDVCKEVFDRHFFHIPESKRDYVEELLTKMLIEEENIDETSWILQKIYFKELILFLIRCHKNGKVMEDIDAVAPLISAATKYIYENSSSNLGLNEVADKFGMSSSYFSKKFKKVTGFGFKEYVIGVKIKNACDLLSSTDKTITEIALECGFNDSNYFGDAFRRIKGISPNKYRKNKGAV